MKVTDILCEEADPIGDLIKSKGLAEPQDDLEKLIQGFMGALAPAKPIAPTAPATVKVPPTAGIAKPPAVVKAPPLAPSPKVTALSKPVPPPPTVAGAVPFTSVATYLKSKGLSPAHIIGMLTNIQHESQFKPDVEGWDVNGPSGGLFQHHNERFTAMKQFVGPDWKKNWQRQVDFALSEPIGAKYVSSNFPSARAASEWWTKRFEIPAHKEKQAVKRSKSVNQYAHAVNNIQQSTKPDRKLASR